MAESPKLLRRPQVEALTTLRRSTMYELIARGEFPLPVRLGQRVVAWREDEVLAWIEGRTADRDGT